MKIPRWVGYLVVAGVIGILFMIAIPQFASYRHRGTSPSYKEIALAPPGSTSPVVDREAQRPAFNTEAYDHIDENPFMAVKDHPLSTFGVDVDTASYANVRRFLNEGIMPPIDSVRIEEMVNYFSYNYPEPDGGAPFSVQTETASCPWHPEHRLLRIGIKGRSIPETERPASNLVFLLDVSGSMNSPRKLPLLKRAMTLLVNRLNEKDRVSIVVYAGASGLVLPSTPCGPENKGAILAALEQLEAGGSTHGSAGIRLAYETAEEHLVDGGINRVILATDGDFNVGVTNQGDLVRLIEEKAKSGVFLTVLGFGQGNLKDSTMEKLADKGNGNYGYIDTINEARKMLVEEMGGTLITIAKDVKIQIEFNPLEVASYRLIGYENRLLRDEDFNDDTKDAGDIGAGHTMTALYEIKPRGGPAQTPGVDPLKYQQPRETAPAAQSGELATVKLRYKEPDGNESRLLTYTVVDNGAALETASEDFRFAAAVAGFGMLLRDSKYMGRAGYEDIIELALSAKGEDRYGYRAEFINLVRNAGEMSSTPGPKPRDS